MRKKTMITRDAAHRLGIGLHHLYELIWSKKLPARRVDGRWLIPAAAVEARLKAKKNASTR